MELQKIEYTTKSKINFNTIKGWGSEDVKKRFKKNLNIYKITLKELEQKKRFQELSYPESIGYDKNNRINYKQSIGELKVVIRSLKQHLGIIQTKTKDSGIIKERRKKLDIHLKKLRELRKKRKRQ